LTRRRFVVGPAQVHRTVRHNKIMPARRLRHVRPREKGVIGTVGLVVAPYSCRGTGSSAAEGGSDVNDMIVPMVLLGVGAWLVYAGVRDESPLAVLGKLLAAVSRRSGPAPGAAERSPPAGEPSMPWSARVRGHRGPRRSVWIRRNP
jgi:hypothetical protein